MNRNPVRLWDFPSAALLILVLLTASQRLYTTHWTWGLESAIILTLLGVALGMALGFSIFGQRTVFWLTFGFSVPTVILVLGRTLYREISWLERLADISNRLAYSIDLFITKQPVKDTILFVVFIALVFWIIGLMAGYAMTRFGNIVGAIVPAGVVFVIVQLFDSSRANSDNVLAFYFFLCLLFLGRLTYAQRSFWWKEQHVSLLAESRMDLNMTFAMVALATVLLVWLAPTSVKSFSNIKTAWENITQPLRDVQENLGHAVSGLQAEGKVQTVQFFGDVLPLGRQAATGETTYFQIQSPLVKSTSRYYWRVRSYDTYLNNQWYTKNITRTLFAPDQDLISLADPEGLTSKFTFTAISVNLVGLITPARPVWVSHPSELFFTQVPQGKMDPVQILSDSPVLAGEKYEVHANEYQPTIIQLQYAGKNYPEWVTKAYLQLPDRLSLDVVALAHRITADATNPYDMADAITKYLRDNYTYSNTVVAPPPGRDPIDWFLFDSKKGFCNYFATAEVILLRSAGVPARLVVGFAQGEFASPDTYTVRQQDSHAWPEVYFPGAGWVEFEPTTSQTPLTRPLGDSRASAGQVSTEGPASEARQGGKGQKLPAWAQAEAIGIDLGSRASAVFFLRLILICAIIATIRNIYTFSAFNNLREADQQVIRGSLPILLKQLFEKRALTPPGWLEQWAFQSELNPIERSFRTIYRSLQWLGEKAPPSQTPAEAADELTKLLPGASQEINSLLNEYQRHYYSEKHASLNIARRDMNAIRRETLHVAIRQRLRALRDIFRRGSF